MPTTQFNAGVLDETSIFESILLFSGVFFSYLYNFQSYKMLDHIQIICQKANSQKARGFYPQL